MLTIEQERAVYRLLGVPGMGSAAVGRVLAGWQKAPEPVEEFWGRRPEEYRTGWGLPARAARYLAEIRLAGAAEREAEAVVAAARAAEIEVLCVLDPDYAALAADRDLPPVLFTRGNQDLLWEAGAAILHSRGAPEAALVWGAGVAEALAERGIGLISGHNRDGYRRTATAGKRATAPLIIVLDRPLHGEPAAGPQAEPVATARIWDAEFHPERELVVSAMGPGYAWTPAHARGRDTLIARLASGIVAGGVRPGGIMEGLCARAAAAGRPVFRSPYCEAGIEAAALSTEVEAAAEVITRALVEQRQAAGASAGRVCPRPGWLERRWSAEVAAFVASLEAALGDAGWVECRPAGPLPPDAAPARGGPQGELIAAVALPVGSGAPRAEMVIVGLWQPAARDGDEEAVLVLSPGEALGDLRALRAYLTRCRARVEEALKAPPPSRARAPGRSPIPDGWSSPG